MKRLLDVHFDDVSGLFDAVIYVLGPNGEQFTRLVVEEKSLTDGSTVIDARIGEESSAENVDMRKIARLALNINDIFNWIKTVENDDGKIPDWLWKQRNELIERVEGDK